MSGPYILRKGVSRISDLKGGQAALGLGIGNIYYVIKTSESYYQQFLDDYQGEYSDGSKMVHPDAGTGDGIQTALDATVECRNDYVIVQPSDSDYELTTPLTLSKKCIHLLAPAGLGNEVGSTNAVRLDQNTTGEPVFTVSDASIEIAGFYIKNDPNYTALDLAQNAYAPNIHHNSFIMLYSSTSGEPVIDNVVTGNVLQDGGSWGSIERNWFVGAQSFTTLAKIINLHSNCTAGRVRFNEFTIGDGGTVTCAVYNDSVKGAVDYNVFKSGGGAYGGSFTHCVHVHASGSAVGNRGSATDGTLVSGGTQNLSFSDNINSASGGAIDDEQ